MVLLHVNPLNLMHPMSPPLLDLLFRYKLILTTHMVSTIQFFIYYITNNFHLYQHINKTRQFFNFSVSSPIFSSPPHSISCDRAL